VTAHLTRRALAATVACIVLATTSAAAQGIRDRITGGVWTYEVVRGDTWRSIGARVGVDAAVLANANALRLQGPLRVGQRVQIDNRHIVPDAMPSGSLVVNVPQRMLFFADAMGDVTGLPVAVGRPTWRTPVGPFRIRSRERDPSWEVPGSIRDEARRQGNPLPAVVPPGPTNPLGKFWLGLSFGDIGIHGTNAPASIYSTATHGCIRLHPDDVAWLFDRIDVGTIGTVISQPVLFAVVGDEIFVEAHRDVYGSAPADEMPQLRRRAIERRVEARIDWTIVEQIVRRRDGVARRVDATPCVGAAPSSGRNPRRLRDHS
jgi:L,D-transpeptidase ErfK/SrfK